MTRSHQQSRGVAVLWVVLVCGLLAVLVIGLLTATLAEHKAAQGDLHSARAELVVDSVVQEVMAKLATGFDAAAPARDGVVHASVTASPGLLEVLQYQLPYNRGQATGRTAFQANAFLRQPFLATYDNQPANPRWIPLFSWKYFAPQLANLTQIGTTLSDENPEFNPAASFNINTRQNPFTPGFCYLSGVGGDPAAVRYERNYDGRWADTSSRDQFALQFGETSAERPVWVQWIPILKHPGERPSKENPMVARYAYWVDVENTKLHLDRASRPLREDKVFARFLGESDGVLSGGGYFEQGVSNPYRLLRQQAEALVPSWDRSKRQTLDGRPGPGLAPLVAAEVREAWLGWRGPQPPAAADTSLIDWDFFAALRPRGTAERMALDDLFAQHAHRVAQGAATPFQNAGEAFSLLDPNLRRADEDFVDTRADLMRQLIAGSATVWGHEEERDPLGRAKIDLPKWQSAVTSGAGVSLQAIQASALWTRLHDSKYHNAYYPAAFPSAGQPHSFVQTWNRFAGDGDPNNEVNGESAVLQMLVNIAEYGQPADVPPLIDPDLGIVGARSIPYVAEVTTRARSAIFLLPPEVRQNLATAFLPDGTAKDGGKPLSYYASHVLLDLAIGCVNSNPFETEPFRGKLELDLEWSSPPPDAELATGPFIAPLQDRFTTSPESGKDPDRIHVLGHTAYFRLGTFPAAALLDKRYATVLRIKGWRIRREDGQLCHQVPVRHPGAKKTREWWQLAQEGENAGSPFDPRSLAAFQVQPEVNGFRAVGWFSRPALDSMMPDSLWLSGLASDALLNPAQQARVANWARLAPHSALLERVFSLDPPLGHRTGDSTLTGLFGRGHFYGALGHTWRRMAVRDVYTDAKPGQTQLDLKELVLDDFTYPSNSSTQKQVSSARGVGAFLAPGSLTITIASADVQPGPHYQGKYYTQYWMYPTEKQEVGAVPPTSLTGLYLLPELEGPLPMGDLDGTQMVDMIVPLDANPNGRTLHDFDVETSSPMVVSGDLTSFPDPKKSSRSFYSHAPAGRRMATVGEIGFCHSGFPNRPILFNPEEGRTDYQLNNPRHGPPMRMLLDLFVPGSFTDPDSGAAVSVTAWRAGQYQSASPEHPRRGVWSVNTAIADDQYMALREGGGLLDNDLDNIVDPGRYPAHAVWLPNAAGHARRERGAEKFHGKELDDLFKKDPGHTLDRHEAPFAALPRPWVMWLSLIGGDFSPSRASGGQLWGINNVTTLYGGAGAFTWSAGKGLGQRAPYHALTFVDLEVRSGQRGKLLAFGTEGRSNDMLDSGTGDGFLRGRWAADQNLQSIGSGRSFYLPARNVTRLSLFPMRHFLSDIVLDYRSDAEFHYLKTPLNPRQSSYPSPGTATMAAGMEGNAFPGGYHSTGVFYNAPMALLTNQAGTSANAFTAHIVTQTVRDKGQQRAGIEHSGYGYSDPDDEVLAERWARVVIEKETNQLSGLATFRVVFAEAANR